MIVDATDADRGQFARSFDACVIGTGPAGITLARRLAARGFTVALMEGGGLDLEPESQELYEGEVVGHDGTLRDGCGREAGSWHRAAAAVKRRARETAHRATPVSVKSRAER